MRAAHGERTDTTGTPRLTQNACVFGRVRVDGRYFRDLAPTVQWTGVDGSEGIEEATQRFVRFADLATDGLPRTLRRPWDWVLSTQVAEHIPPLAEAAFMHTLTVHAQKGVVLEWAQVRRVANTRYDLRRAAFDRLFHSL